MNKAMVEAIGRLPRWALESFCCGALDILCCRAGKLLVKRKPFIVVANDEPYFEMVYETIRENERIKGTWTPEDNDRFLAAVSESRAKHND